MDQGLVGRPREECANDIHVDDIREGVESLGEPTDVIPQGLAGLLLAALEVPGVTRADICPLEISDEDPLEVDQVMDAIVREEFEPRLNMFPHADGEVLNDEVVIIHSHGSAGEPEVFEPYTGIHLYRHKIFVSVPRAHAASQKGPLDGVDPPSFSSGVVNPAQFSQGVPVNLTLQLIRRESSSVIKGRMCRCCQTVPNVWL